MIDQTTIDSGIRVVTDSMPQVRSVTIGFWLACGSRHESAEQAGIAHLIEHMLFKGTAKRTAKQLALEVDCIGGQMNAFTSSEYTCYYIKVLDTHVEKAFELLSDMLLEPLFAPADIKKEKQVILQEYDMYEDSPEDLIQDRFFSYIWPNHPLGRKIIGDRKTVKKISEKDIVDFFKDFYIPSNLLVAVAGNIEHKKVVSLVDRYLSAFKGESTKQDAFAPEFRSGSKFIEKDIEQMQIIWGIPGLSFSDPDWYAANVLNNIIGASSSSRLFQSIREEKGLAYSIYSGFNSYSDSGIFTVSSGVKPEKSKQLLVALDKQIAELLSNGVTETELNKAKEQIVSGLLMGLESSSGRMNRIGKLAIMNKPVLPIEDTIDKISRLQLEEINKAGVRLFKDSEPAVLMLGPKTVKRAKK